MISVVVPVYKNEENVPPLLDAMAHLQANLDDDLEVVFVVDGSPDNSYRVLRDALPKSGLTAQLLLLSRNFGAFSAVKAGLRAGRGDCFAVMAADLQEPPELVREFQRVLSTDEADVAVGVRAGRDDPWLSRCLSGLFWALYRCLVQPEIPPGGVDVFGVTRAVRDEVLKLEESNSSLIGILFWVGFRRAQVPYYRRRRNIGKSAWSLSKRLRYLTDSVFGFTDLPIRLLIRFGLFGLLASISLTLAVLVARFSGTIDVPGYAATLLTVVFFGALNAFGLGIIGNYIWRAFENTKTRPHYIVAKSHSYDSLPAENIDE